MADTHLFPFVGGDADDVVHELYEQVCKEMEEMFTFDDTSDLSSRLLRMKNNAK